MYRAEIKVTLKPGVLDPQGNAVENSLKSMNITEVEDVRIGKLIQFTVNESDKEKANSLIEQACQRLLANPTIENYEFELLEV